MGEILFLEESWFRADGWELAYLEDHLAMADFLLFGKMSFLLWVGHG